MKVDAAGNLWATGPGGLLIISPDGKLLGRVLTHRATANVAFGGEDGKSVFLTAHDRIDGPTGSTCSEHRGVEGMHGDHGVDIQSAETVFESPGDSFEVLLGVNCLDETLFRLIGGHLMEGVPQRFVRTQGVHYDRVSFRGLRMARACVVLFESGVMDDCCLSHSSNLNE
jgi:hypothetical protein